MQIIQKYFSDIEECVRNFNINVKSLQSNNLDDFLYTTSIIEYKKLFLNLLLCTSKEDINRTTQELVNFTIEHDISYLFLYSEIVTVVRKLLGSLAKKHDFENMEEIDNYFAGHEYRITNLYLDKFLNELKFKCELRLSHIEFMPDKKFMIHYESHLEWIIKLIIYIQKEEFGDDYPELNSNLCEFGKWMKSTPTIYLLSSSHFKLIDRLHINLHDLAKNVVTYCKGKELHPKTLIHFMQQIEYYSLKIGNEIAFLNEIEESAKDPLTHLLTRRLFNKIMLNKLEIAKAAGREFTLMMCDLDHFKVVNDTYGHAVGDKVLKHFSNILEKTLRKSDYIFRFGGEEFMVLLPMTDKKEALILARKICDITASKELIIEETVINYTVSIGVISILVDNKVTISQDTIDKYVIQVDAKLYLAKKRGRNRVE